MFIGSMELMFLLLGEKICNSSVQVKFLVTDPPNARSKCVLPISMIELDDDDPYWNDNVEKYFSRPHGEPFDSITYKEYFEQYKVRISPIPSGSRVVHRDGLGNYVVKRKTPIFVRYRCLQPEHGEMYFYQMLLISVPARSEDDLRGEYNTYRDHYVAKNPVQFSELASSNHLSSSSNFGKPCICWNNHAYAGTVRFAD